MGGAWPLEDFMSFNGKVAFTTAAVAAFMLGLVAVTSSFAQSMGEKTVMVGGAPMYPSKNIQNAVNSKDHTTLVAAVKAAGRKSAQAGEQGPVGQDSHLSRGQCRCDVGCNQKDDQG
jgi:hypothetical protein